MLAPNTNRRTRRAAARDDKDLGRSIVPTNSRSNDQSQGSHGNIAICPPCGVKFTPLTSRQRYCSVRCRVAAFRASRKSCNATDDARPGNEKINAVRQDPIKKAQINEGVRNAKNWARRPPIYGPRQVIEDEVFAGREWHQVVSDDGVVSLVAKLGKPLIRGTP